jgi:enoyl-CoA hydratase/carnithine racemase
MGDEDPVLFSVADSVATIMLNRPERNNAWTYDMERQYFAALDRADVDPEVRVAGVTGAGRAFCPGLDVEQLRAVAATGAIPTEGRLSQSYALKLRKPLIAAINGACAGIGLVQALMCDIRFAARGARMTTAYARRGLVAEYGTSWLLARVVGQARALDLLLSARVFDADEAYEMGLVNRVCDPEDLREVAAEYARDLATNCSPMSMLAIKRQVFHDGGVGLTDSQRQTFALMQSVADHPDFVEGVASFAEKRAPRFQPLADDFDVQLTDEAADRDHASDGTA